MKITGTVNLIIGVPQEFTKIQCENPECMQRMIVMAIWGDLDDHDGDGFASGLQLVEQSGLRYCPYCGKEQSSWIENQLKMQKK